MCLNIPGNAVNRDDVRKFRDLEIQRSFGDLEEVQRFRGDSWFLRRFMNSELIQRRVRGFKGDSEQLERFIEYSYEIKRTFRGHSEEIQKRFWGDSEENHLRFRRDSDSEETQK